MTSRKDAAARRRALAESIREASSSGALQPDEMLPTVRELSAQYGLSAQTVSLELRRLVAEGLLYTVPRVGVFRSSQVAAARPFLFLAPPTDSAVGAPMHTMRLQIGFEERAAELGMACIGLPLDIALEHRRDADLPEVAGIFDASLVPGRWPAESGLPYVQYATPMVGSQSSRADQVSFDNEGGGRAATEHLIRQGHRVIAFLGLHVEGEHNPYYEYSAHRANGWAEAMAQAGVSTEGLLHTAKRQPADSRAEPGAAAETAAALIARADITAVVGANDHAVLGLIDQLRRADIPASQWPAVVGFDGTLTQHGQLVTSIRLPWERVGQAAADILWGRRNGSVTGPPVQRGVTMTLITRLSSRPNWPTGSSAAMFGEVSS